jgi:hypothetical protein
MKKPFTLALLLICLTASFAILTQPVWADSFLDNFNDGNYNGWTVYSGTWSVASGQLHGQGSGSPICTNTNFPSDRFVQSEIRTETAGGQTYDVAVLMIKWVNLQNQIDLRIFTDGTIELIMWKNGYNVFQRQIDTNPDLSPFISHIFTASVTGTNIKVWIDGDPTPEIDETNSNFDDISGAVGYQTSSSCYFDDVSVSYPSQGSPSLIAYGYDDYGQPVTAAVSVDGTYRGDTNTGSTWSLTSANHQVEVNVPGGYSFHHFVSNTLSSSNPFPYGTGTNPVTVNVSCPMTITVYYTTNNPPQPQGYDYGTGRASAMFSTDWLMLSKDLTDVNNAFSTIYSLYNVQGVYGHLENYKSITTVANVVNQVQDLETHDWSTIFYYGHMSMKAVSGTPPGYDWPAWSYGIHVQANPADQNPCDSINDTTIWPYTYGGLHFVFLWVCNNGNFAGSSMPYAHGAPYCWTDQYGLSDNGYSDPDYRSYCFISFENASVTLTEGMGTYNNTENSYRYWLTFFYYYALDQGYTIHDSLYWASRAVSCTNGWADPQNNRLYQGYDYTWWGGAGKPFEHIWGKMRIYGNSYINLR